MRRSLKIRYLRKNVRKIIRRSKRIKWSCDKDDNEMAMFKGYYMSKCHEFCKAKF